MTHFHVTNRRAVDAILTDGLRTAHNGWDHRYVWMFDCRKVAEAALAQAKSWGGYPPEDCVILAVNTTGLDVVPDPHPGWGDGRDDHAYAIAGDVPADRIEVLS